MPIFEYRCEACGTTFERLTLRPQELTQITLPALWQHERRENLLNLQHYGWQWPITWSCGVSTSVEQRKMATGSRLTEALSRFWLRRPHNPGRSIHALLD